MVSVFIKTEQIKELIHLPLSERKAEKQQELQTWLWHCGLTRLFKYKSRLLTWNILVAIATMCFLNNNHAPSPLVFIPNLLKPPGTAARSSIRPACPTRQPLGHPALIPSPPASRLPTVAVLSRNATSSYHAVPSIVNISTPANFQTLPLIGVSTSESDPSFSTANATDNLPSASLAPAPQRRGHRHTEESRRKIGIANRGNIPWNKGRRHSEETKRKIAENTKRAMLRPEMRQMLQQRAKGRKHTEATKLKIRETARLTRGTAKSAKRRQKRCPVPYAFAPDVVKHLNDNIAKQIEETFVKDHQQDNPKYVVREKRVVSEETRQKLSRRIKEMWSDPDYRSRVTSGVEERYRRLAERSKIDHSEWGPEESAPTSPTSPTKRRPRLRKRREAGKSHETKRTRYPPTGHNYEDNADIVLDPDSLKGWTKEDLGITGMHGAGRIDEAILGTSRQSEVVLSQNQDDGYSFDSHEPRRQLLEAGTVDNRGASYEHRIPLTHQASDPKFSAPFPAAIQELDFSRLDIATDYALSGSYGNNTDLFEEPVAPFSQEREVDPGMPVGPLDQGDEYFAGPITEKIDHDSLNHVGSDRNVTVHRSSLNYMDNETNAFESF